MSSNKKDPIKRHEKEKRSSKIVANTYLIESFYRCCFYLEKKEKNKGRGKRNSHNGKQVSSSRKRPFSSHPNELFQGIVVPIPQQGTARTAQHISGRGGRRAGRVRELHHEAGRPFAPQQVVAVDAFGGLKMKSMHQRIQTHQALGIDGELFRNQFQLEASSAGSAKAGAMIAALERADFAVCTKGSRTHEVSHRQMMATFFAVSDTRQCSVMKRCARLKCPACQPGILDYSRPLSLK